MKYFKIYWIQRLLLLVSGIAFLNLSFILAEIPFVSFLKDNPYIENLATNGLEEENETDNESNEKGSSLKEIQLSVHHHNSYYSHLVAIFQKASLNHYYAALANGHKTIFSPPPEV